MTNRQRRIVGENVAGWLYLVPALALFALFVLYPIVSVFGYSLNKWDGMGAKTFLGLTNFTNIFTSDEFLTVLGNNLKFLLLGVPLWTIFPLVIAILIQDEVRGWRTFRSVYFFPTVLSTAVLGTMFRTFFLYDGPINQFLGLFGVPPVEWLASGLTSIPLIIIVINWVGFGSATLLFLAGMAAFPKDIFEAAELDGVTWLQKVRYIVLPLLKPTLRFVIMLNILSCFTGLFGYVFMMTHGGPGYETTVLEYLLYTKAFVTHNFGEASAVGVILFALVAVITAIQFRLNTKADEDLTL